MFSRMIYSNNMSTLDLLTTSPSLFTTTLLGMEIRVVSASAITMEER